MSGGDHELPLVTGERAHRGGVGVDQGLEQLR
jgi:hypothetical protein